MESSKSINDPRFLVALSFPGEKRFFVERIAEYLSAKLGRDRVFYDEYYEAELGRPNLDTYLQNIYGNQSFLVVPFFSKDYEHKPWCCKVEWQAIRSALNFSNKPDEYLMAVRFDDTPIPGFLPLDGYINIGGREPTEIAELILQRLNIDTTPKPPKGRIMGGFPTSIDDNFLGRDEDLESLHMLLQKGDSVAITHAITGQGGIGKTRLAIEYAYRYRDAYSHIFYMRAIYESKASRTSEVGQDAGAIISPTIDAGLAVLADSIDILQLRPGLSQNEAVSNLLKYLRDLPTYWLLVLDNIDTENEAIKLLKNLCRFENGRLLITTRWSHWGRSVQVLPLDTVNIHIARNLLLQLSDGRQIAPDDEEKSLELAILLSSLSKQDRLQLKNRGPKAVLGGLPLILEQAAFYIGHRKITFDRYMKEWRDQARRHKLIDHIDRMNMSHDESLLVTISQTINILSPNARIALGLLSWISPDTIPFALLEDYPEIFERAISLIVEGCQEPNSLEVDPRGALVELEDYSLLTFRESMIILHGMVQEATRICYGKNKEWIELVVDMVNHYLSIDYPSHDVRSWPFWEPMRPHVESLIESMHTNEGVVPDFKLISKLAAFDYSKGLFLRSMFFEEMALKIAEEELGPKDIDLASRLLTYGESLRVLGREKEAEKAFRRAVDIRESRYGQNSVEVASDLNYVALCLEDEKEKEKMFRRILSIYESIDDPDKGDLYKCLNNLGTLLIEKGEYDEAEILLKRAEKTGKEEYGADNPLFVHSIGNLGKFFLKTNNFTEAEYRFRQAIEILRQHLPINHPDLEGQVSVLANLLRETHRLNEAIITFSQITKMDRVQWGSSEQIDEPLRQLRHKLRICETSLTIDLADFLSDRAQQRSANRKDLEIVASNEAWHPVMMQALTIMDSAKLQFTATIDSGTDKVGNSSLRKENRKLFSYLLTAIAIPEEEQWASTENTMPKKLRGTRMGQDLYQQSCELQNQFDMLLHEKSEDREAFIKAIKQVNLNIPSDLNFKILLWIAPSTQAIYEGEFEDELSHLNNSGEAQAFVIENDLKIYFECIINGIDEELSDLKNITNNINEVFEEHVVPLLLKKIKNSREFGVLRQIYNCMILATWFKGKYRLHPKFSKYLETGRSNQLIPNELSIADEEYLQFEEEQEPVLRVRLDDAINEYGKHHLDVAFAQNELAVCLRQLGKLDEAETLLRQALKIEISGRGKNHPKIPHLLNGLSTVLLMNEKSGEAIHQNEKAWRLKCNQHDLTSARILLIRLILCALFDTDIRLYISQTKMLVVEGKCEATVGISEILRLQSVLDYIKTKLNNHNFELIFGILNALNDQSKFSELDRFPAWKEIKPISLEKSWPQIDLKCRGE